MKRTRARKEEDERTALAGIGFNILLLGFIAQWLDFFPEGMAGSILRLIAMSLAVSFFVVGIARALRDE